MKKLTEKEVAETCILLDKLEQKRRELDKKIEEASNLLAVFYCPYSLGQKLINKRKEVAYG